MEAAAATATLVGSSLHLHPPPSSSVTRSTVYAARPRLSFPIKHYSSLACSGSWNKRMVLESRRGIVVRASSRIAEVKANERKRALEEILYALVVLKFMDADVSLVPAITPSSKDSSGQVDTWPSQEEKFEQLHSPEAYEMIQSHLALILGNRLNDSKSVAQISKIRVGQVYAASVMYGYFLKRVDERFQLEKTMKILPNGSDSEGSSIEKAIREDIRPAGDYLVVSSHLEVSSWSGGFGNRIKPSRLRTYLMSFDGDILQRFATIRSKEAVSIIEKQTEALFGRPEIVLTPQGTVDSSKDELIKISFGGLKKLVLEAITFGSFLWDGESFVDSRYHFVMN
ncbi:Ribosomal L11 methyltransferase [Gossypium arboreum]|uniref:Ribosomal L11 methyltransferase n=1 Tax=Gossypium arboreum TaxID=29729 RepID=A0A0B0N791_GOSAR|nr:Ribosomal L11 methyltransferase [Gossypium arboreum]